MLRQIAKFELGYQIKNPLFVVATILFFLAAFANMAGFQLISIGGGNVLFNSPHSIIVYHLGVSFLFLFVGAAFTSSVIIRDDQTGFAPIIRCTRITKFDYLFGRFLGAFAAAAVAMAAVTVGAFLGTFVPFADEMLGPNRASGYLYGYGLFALPNALIISAMLFTIATVTRSTAGTFVGVILLLVLYFVSQGLMQGQPQLLGLRAFVDPFGMSTYMASSRYYTAAELNAGSIPVTTAMLQSRILWIGLSVGLLALTYGLFQFSDRAMSKRELRKLGKQPEAHHWPDASSPFVHLAPWADPVFDSRASVIQFFARAQMEARHIIKSQLLIILLVMATVFCLPSLLSSSGFLGAALYPLTAISVPVIQSSFAVLVLIIAAFYSGEAVWRERERKINEIIDATPLPDLASMLPKFLGLWLVLVMTLSVGMAVSIFVQLLDGSVAISTSQYLRWYVLPGTADAAIVAALAIFVQALSPSKFSGWGVMALYIILLFVGPSIGFRHPLMLYGSVPDTILSDMSDTGNWSAPAWWFRLFWGAMAAFLLLALQLIWPRGADQGLKSRLSRLNALFKGSSGKVAAIALMLVGTSGSWIVYNTLILNKFRSPENIQKHQAAYEKRYFKYALVPQPTVRHVELDVAIYPSDLRAEIRGRLQLVNETQTAIERVHVRLLNSELQLIELDFPQAQLVSDDPEFSYRIYRLDTPMKPGAVLSFAFHTRRSQFGFRAANNENRLAYNGTDLNTLELIPRIGMSDVGMIEDSRLRRQYGLPERSPFPRLNNLTATKITPSGDNSWTTSDITVSTVASQIPVAPGKKVSERVVNGRRTIRYVSNAPIKNLMSVQSAEFAINRQTYRGVSYSIYYHPSHRWNVDRMMRAMRASIDYYRQAFGPYQFSEARIVERPGLAGGGQAFPNTIAVSESIFAIDLRNPDAFDAVTLLTAHELAHQWWGHQVLGARMQGGSLLYETLAQYSALMVTKRLRRDEDISEFLQFQLDRYLTGRRTQVAKEQPLSSVEIGQDYIAYGKGPLAFYLLQKRMGEPAMNRALRRFVDKYRFTAAPYPRSVDLIAMLRQEAKSRELQVLITDLFERITIYDLSVRAPTAVRRADGKWNVTVPLYARKYYADGLGAESEGKLAESIEVALFTGQFDGRIWKKSQTISMKRHPVRSGRQVLKFVTDQKPSYAGIDPYNLYIDRNSSDNFSPVI